MAYSKFTIQDLREKFGILDKRQFLFEKIKPLSPSEWLLTTLNKGKKVVQKSEKSRSELIVTPILLELLEHNQNHFTFYSGETLEADKKAGLTGTCDYIIARNLHTLTISYPILALVEAEKNDFDLGIPQCIAQMLGAKVYNRKFQQEIAMVYGCVTTGTDWLFMRLENEKEVKIDTEFYFINNLELILGIFQQIIEQYKNL